MANQMKILFSILWLFVQVQAAAPKVECEACGPLKQPKVVFHVTFDGSNRSLAAYIHNSLKTEAEVAAVQTKAPLIMCAAARDILKHNYQGKHLLTPNVPNSFTFQEYWDCKIGTSICINDFDVKTSGFTYHKITSYQGNCAACSENHQVKYKSNFTDALHKVD